MAMSLWRIQDMAFSQRRRSVQQQKFRISSPNLPVRRQKIKAADQPVSS
jgi:hypothetical protein